jgi:hypothetical protein
MQGPELLSVLRLRQARSPQYTDMLRAEGEWAAEVAGHANVARVFGHTLLGPREEYALVMEEASGTLQDAIDSGCAPSGPPSPACLALIC